MILLGFYSTLFTYMSSSPIWPTYDTNPVCRETWIWNVLHINNFNTNYNQCMNMTWFLACLMQLYVVSPLFMIPLNRWPRIGYVLSVVTICISSIACFILTKQYNLLGSVPKIELQSNALEEVNKRLWQFIDELYQKTYVRFTPYLTGILLGYYLHNRRLTKKNDLVIRIFLNIFPVCFVDN
ncbi:hypothetical protein AVEN_13834-1 [Araneus ventricosus]|uniref:Acyltransferase 3 domain-containing protein n=1 Tax=Araneus ventricosus TaxID=182803 RepID=A0A4Y2PWN5_ARAVE|nr:hypothetical protein AVEN_13834-1 [Araneus ventricosus]